MKESSSTQKNPVIQKKDAEILTSFQVKADKTVVKEKDEIASKICCAVHGDQKPYWVCTVCKNLFCKACPASDSGRLKFCPFCGGTCVLYSGLDWKYKKGQARYNDYDEDEVKETKKKREPVKTSMELIDFMAAMTYPFYYPSSLAIGVILYLFLIFGQIMTVFAGGWTFLATFGCIVVVVMMKFGVMLKTIENFRQADFKKSFLPRIKKLTIREDLFHSLFVGISVYIASFGLFVLMAVSLGVYASNSNPVDLETKGKVSNKPAGSTNFDNSFRDIKDREQKKIQDQTRQSRFENVFGRNYWLESKQFENFVGSLKNLSPVFYLPVFLSLVFGFFYFPAACILSSKNRSFTNIFNYKAGVREIKFFKSDYVKILLMIFCFIIILILTVVGLIWFFNFLEIPNVGIVVTLLAESALILYFWLAFSGILGILLCKKQSTG